MTDYIYCLIDPRNGQIRYVGKTNNLRTRYTMHLLEKRNTRKNAWLKSLSKYNARPLMEVLEVFEDSNDLDWQHAERFWISYLRFLGFNLTNHDSGGNAGRRQCQETKDAIRIAHIGLKHKPETIEKIRAIKIAAFTDEERDRLGKVNLGRKHSDEVRRARSNAMFGHETSEETKRKISDAQKGKLVSAETCERIRQSRLLQTNVNTNGLINFKGQKRRDETRRKMSEAQVMRGPVSDETKLKQRLAKLGRKQSPEAIEAAHAPLRGLKRSPETRAKMSEAKRLGWARKKALQLSLV